MLRDVIEHIQNDLRSGRFTNEAAVSQGIVLPVLYELGWPVFDTRSVAPEYALEGRRVDFALCDGSDRPKVFLEVKRVGQAEGAIGNSLSTRSTVACLWPF
jgi:predicted type IV restriction endonuclease